MPNTYNEFKELVESTKKVKKLEVGCHYYIEDMDRRNVKHRDVFHGKFLKKDGRFNMFENVKYVLNPFSKGGTPNGFDQSRRYFQDNRMMCDKNIEYLDKVISELKKEVEHLKYLPVEEEDTKIDFIGKEYRNARDDFYRKTRRSISSSSSRRRKSATKSKTSRQDK